MTVVARVRGERAEDPRVVEAYLRRDRLYAAYPLCQLERPERCRCGLARDGSQVAACAVLYQGDVFDGMAVAGEPSAVVPAIRALGALPPQFWLWAGEEHLPPLADHLRVGSATTMLRLAVTAATFRPAPRNAGVRRLGPEDFAAVERLYRHTPGTVFRPQHLSEGVYYGALVQGDLVAVAGTHGRSRRHRVAIVGNVLTHPAWRNRGLSTACTSVLTLQLLREHDDVVLNVAADNAPAKRVYATLGYQMHCRLVELQVGQWRLP